MEFNHIDSLAKLLDALRSIPEFTGLSDPEACIDWIHACEEHFDFKAAPINRRVSLVTKRLRGRAAVWWQKLKQSRLRQRKPKIRDWQKFRKYFARKFIPNVKQDHGVMLSETANLENELLATADFDMTELRVAFFDDKEDDGWRQVALLDQTGPYDFGAERNEPSGLIFDGTLFKEPNNIKRESGSSYDGPPIFDTEPVDKEEHKIDLEFPLFDIVPDENHVIPEHLYPEPPYVPIDDPYLDESSFEEFCPVHDYQPKEVFSMYNMKHENHRIPEHICPEPPENFDSSNNNYYIHHDSYFSGTSLKYPFAYRLKTLNNSRTSDIYEISKLRTISFTERGDDTISPWPTKEDENFIFKPGRMRP
ncbi:hypothetical protein OROMI_006802 [Orobanche minor]